MSGTSEEFRVPNSVRGRRATHLRKGGEEGGGGGERGGGRGGGKKDAGQSRNPLIIGQEQEADGGKEVGGEGVGEVGGEFGGEVGGEEVGGEEEGGEKGGWEDTEPSWWIETILVQASHKDLCGA
ncbi:hypothetical protein BGX38DRAFT_1268109 [Terfezia claveryi]|nr:hypothetical protein BGX38DRAFT_1268109 [Terfezia claveryi]